MNTEEIAFMRLGEIATLEELAKRQREDAALRAVMVEVVADSRRSAPHDRRGVLPERSGEATQAARGPAGSGGWRDTPALETPGGAFGQSLIERMTPAFPQGKAKPDEPPKAA